MSSEGSAALEETAGANSLLQTCPRTWSERRQDPRFPVQRQLMTIPVLPDGRPDWQNCIQGLTLDLSRRGMGLELETTEELPTNELAVGIWHPDKRLEYVGLKICRSDWMPPKRLRVGGQFGGVIQEILSTGRLFPTFHPDSLEFSMGLPTHLLQEWEKAGLLEPVLVDRIQVCPRCGGLPTFRMGCPSCGSACLENERLIHHFACAHVGRLSDFGGNGELACPKCLTNRLVVGTDFEYLNGPYRCMVCQWSDTQLEQIGQCLRCELRFPGGQALHQDVVGYNVHRLDPLALIPKP